MENQLEQPVQRIIKTTNKKNPFKIATIVLAIVVLGLGGLSIFLGIKSSKKDDSGSNSQANQTPNDGNAPGTIVAPPANNTPGMSTDTPSEYLAKRYYLIGNNQRYHLALDNVYSGNDLGYDYKDKDVFLLDMNGLNVKEIDLWSMIKPYYDEKIANLPTTLAEGTTNATPKSSCTSFPISYIGSDALYMRDQETTVEFGVYYRCTIGNEVEHSLGSEAYVLDVNSMKITQQHVLD